MWQHASLWKRASLILCFDGRRVPLHPKLNCTPPKLPKPIFNARMLLVLVSTPLVAIVFGRLPVTTDNLGLHQTQVFRWPCTTCQSPTKRLRPLRPVPVNLNTPLIAIVFPSQLTTWGFTRLKSSDGHAQYANRRRSACDYQDRDW